LQLSASGLGIESSEPQDTKTALPFENYHSAKPKEPSDRLYISSRGSRFGADCPYNFGGFGSQGVRRFYSEHFVSQIPKDAKVTPISRTIGKDQVVDELIVSFTHDTQWDYLLPGIPPTGKRVELPHVVVMKFENGKIAHEHIWWDQASLLVQVGLLDPGNLPVAGVDQAKKLLNVAEGQQ